MGLPASSFLRRASFVLLACLADPSSSTHHRRSLFSNFIKTLNCDFWAGLALISVAGVLALTGACVRRAGLPHDSQSVACGHRYFFSCPSPFSRSKPSLAFLPVHFHCLFYPLSTPSSPPPPLPLTFPAGTILLLFSMTARRSTYHIRPPPQEVFPESTLTPGGLQLTTLFWDAGILFHQGSHAGARVGNNFEVFGCIATRVLFPVLEFDDRPC